MPFRPWRDPTPTPAPQLFMAPSRRQTTKRRPRRVGAYEGLANPALSSTDRLICFTNTGQAIAMVDRSAPNIIYHQSLQSASVTCGIPPYIGLICGRRRPPGHHIREPQDPNQVPKPVAKSRFSGHAQPDETH
jgi:hypothetical protein